MAAVGATVTPLMLDAVVYWLATAAVRQARQGRPLPMLRLGAYALLSLSVTANALGGATWPERLFMALPAALFGYLTEVQIRLALYEHRAERGESDRLGLLLWLRHPVRSTRAKLWQARQHATAFDAAAAERDRLAAARDRSEEHTSELQSHSDLVCRLLLEKKKNTIKPLEPSTKTKPTQNTI